MVHFALGAIVGLPGVVLPALVAGSDGDLVLDPEQAALFSACVGIYSLYVSYCNYINITVPNVITN